ncbi:ornithine carbamoyltransferase [Prosthecochloris sp. N3]|uniref:Ornithine carbamoyltransferase n=1 Tax=Prosthecochloris ethylica TaxID=2743976 RepID=A0ABR9XQ18_9CHLB|nr:MULTISPECIES: ornithine carbamoyltransferase [Prosthecochloris]MEC9487659.1 ornithine carbamoyltransferase [Prosthecochloris sp.]MBF0586227.1 ornithine carbamoyltransferase [Prosthecochloris ethylica]MBF0635933.1 ornithine carbamoyltransferase [Prosthecochloris ethylica]NUK47392.1 ornithine carbamoyltransferase [Prosthecochloris ethylica]RNA65848.1 ornithine carbamoyltransferase [Prosthecochloris sp. ZM_2]
MTQKTPGTQTTKRDFLGFHPLDAAKIIELFDFSAFIKKTRLDPAAAREYRPIEGKTVAMIFNKPSLRTRVSFELGIHELGGYAVNLDGRSIGVNSREAVEDIAQLLSRYNDAIVARLHEHSVIEDLAAHSSIPVINALTDLSHPCQILADAFTLYEKGLWHDGVKVVFVGDGNNVANSWIELAGILPFHFVLACPEGYLPDEGLLERARQHSGSTIEVVHDPMEAAQGADVLYTDVWTSMGQEEEARERLDIFRPFQINAAMLNEAAPSAVVMHCMPAHRGQEISAEVMDGPQSIIMDEAENRLHVQKALLVKLLNHEEYRKFHLTHRLENVARNLKH